MLDLAAMDLADESFLELSVTVSKGQRFATHMLLLELSDEEVVDVPVGWSGERVRQLGSFLMVDSARGRTILSVTTGDSVGGGLGNGTSGGTVGRVYTWKVVGPGGVELAGYKGSLAFHTGSNGRELVINWRELEGLVAGATYKVVVEVVEADGKKGKTVWDVIVNQAPAGASHSSLFPLACILFW